MTRFREPQTWCVRRAVGVFGVHPEGDVSACPQPSAFDGSHVMRPYGACTMLNLAGCHNSTIDDVVCWRCTDHGPRSVPLGGPRPRSRPAEAREAAVGSPQGRAATRCRAVRTGRVASLMRFISYLIYIYSHYSTSHGGHEDNNCAFDLHVLWSIHGHGVGSLVLLRRGRARSQEQGCIFTPHSAPVGSSPPG